jgi:dihydroorotate dehydrogenase electron transfer subunit
MKQTLLKIKENTALIDGAVYKMVLEGDVGVNKAGQFVNLLLPGFTLRRPFGVADATGNSLTILYKAQGTATEYMATLKPNCFEVDTLTCLGNGFDLAKSKKPLLIGGGMGAAPLYYLAKQFNEAGIKPDILLGFRNKSEVFYDSEFKKLGNLHIATDDGSSGFRGNTVQFIRAIDLCCDYYYACGPKPMLKAIADFNKNGCLSLEERMACGFGACMGCSVKTIECYKRVCKEGPVLEAEEVIFE